MHYLIITLILLSTLTAEESVIETLTTPVDLNKIIRMPMHQGLPGALSQDNRVFTSIVGTKTLMGFGITSDIGRIDGITEIPFWMSRRPSKAIYERLSPEQRSFWDAINAEAAICLPGMTKLATLQQTVLSTRAAVTSLKISQDRVIEKAQANNDRAALGATASKARQSKMDGVVASADRADDALKSYMQSSDCLLALASYAKLRALWAEQTKPPVK